MTDPVPYAADLAYVHDRGFGDFARRAVPGLLSLLSAQGIDSGQVVDLGCGSGLWARALADAGYQVTGVDVSEAMLELARSRVPEAEFLRGSFVDCGLPKCRAVTALGEVFNYLFDGRLCDERAGAASLERALGRIYEHLPKGGLLVFDVAGPGRCQGRTQAFMEGDDWTCLVEYQHDEPRQLLTRRIVTFRRLGDVWRRHLETHRQQLHDPTTVSTTLRRLGFDVQTVNRFGQLELPAAVTGFVAKKE